MTANPRRLGPVWPRLPRCTACNANAGPHRGQHGGVRYYSCPRCGNRWPEPPLGFFVLLADGSETILRADEIPELPYKGK